MPNPAYLCPLCLPGKSLKPLMRNWLQAISRLKFDSFRAHHLQYHNGSMRRHLPFNELVSCRNLIRNNESLHQAVARQLHVISGKTFQLSPQSTSPKRFDEGLDLRKF
jgi:hypothetical protein